MIRQGLRRRILVSAVSAVLLISFVLAGVHWRFGSLTEAKSAALNEWIWIRPQTVDLDSQRIGQTVRCTVSVVNESGRSIQVIGVETFCGCLSLASVGLDLPITVPEGEEVQLPLNVSIPEDGKPMREALQVLVNDRGQLRRLGAVVRASPVETLER